MSAVKLGLLPVIVLLMALFAYTLHYETIINQCGDCHCGGVR